MARRSNYDKFPVIAAGPASACGQGWMAIAERLQAPIAGRALCVLCLECYPGVVEPEIEQDLSEALRPARVIHTSELYKSAAELAPHLGNDDPVFGRMNDVEVKDLFASAELARVHEEAKKFGAGLLFVIGTGAALVVPDADLLVYADMPRWEIQLRQRRNEISNLARVYQPETQKLLRSRSWRGCERLQAV